MITTTGKHRSITVPLWVLIPVGALVIAVTTFFVGYSVSQSQPSDADLFARAQAGDREAAETLEAKYAEPAAVEPISSEKSGFMPGIYAVDSTEYLLKTSNGGTVVAFFVYSAILGDERAMDVVKKSKRGSLSSLFNQLRDMPRDYELVHLLFEALELRDSDGNVVEETVILNRKYTTEVVFFFPYMDEETLSKTFQPPSIIFELTRNERREWEITGAN